MVENCYYDVYRRYRYKLHESGVNYKDCVQDVDEVLWKSICTFDESKNTKFSTHFTNYTFYHFKSLVSGKENHKFRLTDPIDYDNHTFLDEIGGIDRSHSPSKVAELRDMKDAIHEIIEKHYKDGTQKKTLLLKYFSSDTVLPNRVVSDKLGIGERQVSRYVKGASKKIKNILEFEEKMSESFRKL